MTGQTKMIFITSDEDLISQISSKKSTNTHIIDLDDEKQMSSIKKVNNNNINLALAELSQLNSNNDQVYRRVLDSPDPNQSNQIKISKKSIDLICKICGDRAIGFNYDVLSCASCKAFFRRNAYQDLEELKCLTGQGQCLVAHGINLKCHRCRLDRCFAMGMRKDFILKKEERQRKKNRLEENQNMPSSSSSTISNSQPLSQTFDDIDRLLLDLDKDDDITVLHESTDLNEMEEILLETLSIEDWITIQNIQSSFSSIMQDDNAHNFNIDLSNPVSALVSWSQTADQIALRFISFFRQIDEFEGLHTDDRFILIKYNLFPLFPIYKCFNYKPTNNYLSYEENEETIRLHQFYTSFPESTEVLDNHINLTLSLVELTKQDSTLLSLLLTILIFSQGLSMNEDEPILKDSLAVNQAQSHYTKVLWNYLVNKRGELQACIYFSHLLKMIFRIQLASKIFRDFTHFHFVTQDSVDQITPLMQAVLNIS